MNINILLWCVVVVGVPFDKNWDKRRMVLAGVIFTEQLYLALIEEEEEEEGNGPYHHDHHDHHGGDDHDERSPHREAIKKLIESRYGRLMGLVDTGSVDTGLASDQTAWLRSFCPAAAALRTDHEAALLRGQFEEAVGELARLFRVVSARERREMWMGNYLEVVANLVVMGQPSELTSYIYCLYTLM